MAKRTNKEGKLRILAVGDLHANLGQARALAKRAKKECVDLVVLNGDFTIAETNLKGILGSFKEEGLELVLLPGNHESEATVEYLARLYGAINLHNSYLVKKGVGLFGCGSANIGLFQLPDGEIFDILAKNNKKIEHLETKIMFTHVHPKASMVERLTSFPGSSGVSRAIKYFKPKIAVCSHIHEAHGLTEKIGDTYVYCVGPTGKIIEA